MIDGPERDTILAALRHWQRFGNTGDEEEYAIALNDHESALDDDAIDLLCERINT